MGLYLVYTFIEVSVLTKMLKQKRKCLKKEAPIDHLQKFLPPGTYEAVLQYLQFYKVHLTVAAERKSITG